MTTVTLPVARALQAEELDVATAMDGLDTCRRMLQSWCEEPGSVFSEILGKAKKVADVVEVEIRPPRCASQSQYRANAGDCGNSGTYCRVNRFLPLLHSVLRQLQARFGERQQESFQLCGLLPARVKPWEDVGIAVMRYAEFLDQEQSSWRRLNTSCGTQPGLESRARRDRLQH